MSIPAHGAVECRDRPSYRDPLAENADAPDRNELHGICAGWSGLGPPPAIPIGTGIPTLLPAGQFDPNNRPGPQPPRCGGDQRPRTLGRVRARRAQCAAFQPMRRCDRSGVHQPARAGAGHLVRAAVNAVLLPAVASMRACGEFAELLPATLRSGTHRVFLACSAKRESRTRPMAYSQAARGISTNPRHGPARIIAAPCFACPRRAAPPAAAGCARRRDASVCRPAACVPACPPTRSRSAGAARPLAENQCALLRTGHAATAQW